MDGGPTASIILVVMVLINMIYNGFSAAMEQLNIKEIEERLTEAAQKKREAIEKQDFEMAANIAANGKLQRPGVCNAIECLLVHEKAAKDFLPKLVAKFDGKAAFRCDEASYQIVMKANNQAANKAEVSKAIPEDFDTEFLDYILAIKTVSSTEEAVDFINAHNTKHSETIITKNTDNAKTFQAKVDASCVYVNASTRFTDGEMFGFGAELGISTQKMHIRGPMGLKALTTTKYLIDGEGQIR